MKYLFAFCIIVIVGAAGASADPNTPEARIVGGTEAKRKQFPFLAGLLLYVEGGTDWCGGVLLSAQWVLTAAKCTAELTTGLDVYLGAWERLNKQEEGQLIIPVPKEDVIVHEGFNQKKHLNDIALIRLLDPVQFNDYVQPAKLPEYERFYPTYAWRNAIITGWGHKSSAESTLTNTPRWAQTSVLSAVGCMEYYPIYFQNTHICADTQYAAVTCVGDYGGPLLLAADYTLIGITSHHRGCYTVNPIICTRVSDYLDWIELHSGVTNRPPILS